MLSGRTAAHEKARVSPPRARHLLVWYDRHGRSLPWRVEPGEMPDAYKVWLAEIMLQQTRVATVAPRYRAFVERFPSLQTLAAAPLQDVLAAWAGLGYYARARKLHQCARRIVQQHGGVFPRSMDALLALPGIGAYTAAAVAAIAFGQRQSAVDGNVLRVMARLYGIHTPLPKAGKELAARAAALVPARRAGDYAQALMDLGATVCTPRKPDCPACPWRSSCQAHAGGEAHLLPKRVARPERPLRQGAVFWVQNRHGQVLLRQRPEDGLLGGMMEFPGTQWHSGAQANAEDWHTETPFHARWSRLEGHVSHGFTHFRLHLTVYAARVTKRAPPPHMRWVALDALHREALPSLMRKVADHVTRHWRRDVSPRRKMC